MKSVLKILFLVFIILSCSPKVKLTTPPVVQTTPLKKTFSNAYFIDSPHGHKFKIEVDYMVKDINLMNNECKAQYVITNIGTKDFLYEERFPIGKVTKNGYTFENEYFDPSIVFEFTTTDGKKMEASMDLDKNILSRKSSAAESVYIRAGDRVCVGEVKPIRIEYRKTIN